jgi:hypothetical protein
MPRGGLHGRLLIYKVLSLMLLMLKALTLFTVLLLLGF